MQISSYTFQSPYPQPFQVGRPDPASSKKEENDPSTLDFKKGELPPEAKLSPIKEVKGVQSNTSITALADGNAQSGVAEYKALSTSVQGIKAYAQEAVS